MAPLPADILQRYVLYGEGGTIFVPINGDLYFLSLEDSFSRARLICDNATGPAVRKLFMSESYRVGIGLRTFVLLRIFIISLLSVKV
jgi:hypothetical protein